MVTARQHPGEANSSWILEGFLRWAAGDSEEAILLRENVVLKVCTQSFSVFSLRSLLCTR